MPVNECSLLGILPEPAASQGEERGETCCALRCAFIYLFLLCAAGCLVLSPSSVCTCDVRPVPFLHLFHAHQLQPVMAWCRRLWLQPGRASCRLRQVKSQPHPQRLYQLLALALNSDPAARPLATRRQPLAWKAWPMQVGFVQYPQAPLFWLLFFGIHFFGISLANILVGKESYTISNVCPLA